MIGGKNTPLPLPIDIVLLVGPRGNKLLHLLSNSHRIGAKKLHLVCLSQRCFCDAVIDIFLTTYLLNQKKNIQHPYCAAICMNFDVNIILMSAEISDPLFIDRRLHLSKMSLKIQCKSPASTNF